MEVVSETSVLEETATAHLQDDLSSIRSFSIHRSLIYSSRDLLCLYEKCSLNKITSGIFLRIERSRPPTVIVHDNSKVQLLMNNNLEA